MAEKRNVRELKPDTGTIDEDDLEVLFEEFGVTLPEEIEFPYSVKLTKKHTLILERRSTQRVTSGGLVNQLNWRLHENLHEPVQRLQ